jgi:imidazolonepropionase-like amidohydrolase
MLSSILCASVLTAASQLLVADASATVEEVQSIAVDYLHVGNGEVLEDVLIQISNGKITAVIAGGKVPKDAVRIEGAHMTPGLVDAFSYLGVDSTTVEESRETTASASLAKSVSLSNPAFQNALEEGVTTAFLTPDSLNVFGGMGAVVKTAGGQPADLFADEGSAAQLLKADAALKISLGNDVSLSNHSPFGRPSGFFTRRPTTRMGAVWAVRKNFHDAKVYMEARKAGTAEFNADLEVLAKVLRGELPLRVQARRNNDIQTVLRLAKEFGWKDITIEEATEAFRCAELLQSAGIKVAAGPAYDSRTRAIASGPSLAELRLAADPPPICCENLHEDLFLTDWETGGPVYPKHQCDADATAAEVHEIARNEYGMAVDPNYADHDHDHDHGEIETKLGRMANDMALLIQTPSTASGLQSGRFSEGDKATPALAAVLDQAGVPAVLGAAEAHDFGLTESSLIHQARRAVQYGLAPQRALAMVTSRAAEFCGLGDRIGLAKVGYDADLVLWSGDPLSATSRPLYILVDGQVMLDTRN